MKSIPVLIIFASFVNAFVSGQNASNSLHCFVCESEQTSACQELADISVLTSTDCKELPRPKTVPNKIEVIHDVISKSVDGKIRGAPLLNSIFEQNGQQRSGNNEMKYVCLTVALSSGDKKGISRTCQLVPAHVKDACDFIKQDVEAPLQIDKCRACSTDYCNSSSAAGLTFFLIFVITMNIILTK